jgi:hypothetical protein
MSNTDPNKNYNGWRTWTQPKTTMDEQHGPNQKLQWMSDTDLTKNYNRWAAWIQPKTTMDEQHGPNHKLQ